MEWAVTWSPEGTQLASAGGLDAIVRVWDAETGQPLLPFKGHRAPVNAVAWSPDGTRLASASDDQTVRVWETTTRQLLLTCYGHTQPIEAVAWSPDGTRLASAGGWDSTVRIWDMGRCDRSIFAHLQGA